MPRFSLRQIFIAIVALAAGLAIWRLPKGEWIDIPVTVLCIYFVLSLLRHAAATLRLLSQQGDLPREQRWGGRILVAELVGTAIALIVLQVFRILAAAKLALTTSPERYSNYDDFLEIWSLPLDLTVLALLVATSLELRHPSPRAAIGVPQKIYLAFGAAGTLVAITLCWAIGMDTDFLVYLAISGVEMAQAPRWLTAERNISTMVRAHEFMAGSLGALAVLIVNVLLVGGMVKWWNNSSRRRTLIVALAAGLVMECWCAHWIAFQGSRRLSPALREGVTVPSLAILFLAALMVLLGVAAYSWRLLATTTPVNPLSEESHRKSYFHENWLGSLLLGVVTTAYLVGSLTRIMLAPKSWPFYEPFGWQGIAYVLIIFPSQILWVAGAIGGFSLAWLRWRRRKERVGDVLPCINPAQFAVTTVSVMILVVTSALVIAAVGFCCWFVVLQ